MIHQLKCQTEYFESVQERKKPFEIRKNDRDFQVGDFLALNEVETLGKMTGGDIVARETGKCLLVRVTYILNDPKYCKDGMIVMGTSPCVVFHSHDGCPVYNRDECGRNEL